MNYTEYDVDGTGQREVLRNLIRGELRIRGKRVLGGQVGGFTAITGSLAANAAGPVLNTVIANVALAAAAPTQADFNALVNAYNALAWEYTKLAGNYRALHGALRSHGLINN